MGSNRRYTRLMLLGAVVGLLLLVILPISLSNGWMESLAWIGGVGTILSAVGVVIAIWQILLAGEQVAQAKISADRAADAVFEFRGQVQSDLRRFWAGEAVRCFTLGDEHKESNRWDFAQLRFGDCAHHLMQLATVVADEDRRSIYESIDHLRSLQEDCRRLAKNGKLLKRNLYAETARLFWEAIRPYHVPSQIIGE